MSSTASSAFESLHPALQRWVWKRGWRELREVQERTIPLLLAGERDVLVAASTAGGKTEAAFLPILTVLAGKAALSLGALYVSPLKALINDQYRRLEELAGEVRVPVHRWHGDVPSSRKKRVLERPAGVLIITPESLEALFVRRGPDVRRLFADLAWVVVDELHAFPGSERGMQLVSLLHRVELAARRRIPRVGLSATLGDVALACEYLRPGGAEAVERVEVGGSGGVRIQVRGYRWAQPKEKGREAEEKAGGADEDPADDAADQGIASHLFETLRGGKHLVFANRRLDVELFADLLSRQCERLRVPREFLPHHGSLSKEIREHAEDRMREARPATVIATSTLELGIDVGAIESVAQIGPPFSVASLRQRLGRSGRQEAPAVLRVYVREPELHAQIAPCEALRLDLVQASAMLELLLSSWSEPPEVGEIHLSTLVQQVLSLVAQHGGIEARQAWRALCSQGPFRGVDASLFGGLLRDLGAAEVVTQTHTGEIVLDLLGERIVDHYSFYAAFQTPEEYRLVSGGREIGRMPATVPFLVADYLVFAGRRWRILDVDEERLVVELAPAPGGRLPRFANGSLPDIHPAVHAAMLHLFRSSEVPRFLHPTAERLLSEGRAEFASRGLGKRRWIGNGKECYAFPWGGSKAARTLLLWARARGLEGYEDRHFLLFMTGIERVLEELRAMAATSPPSAEALAAELRPKRFEKFHPYLSDDRLDAEIASRFVDRKAAAEALLGIIDPASREDP